MNQHVRANKGDVRQGIGSLPCGRRERGVELEDGFQFSIHGTCLIQIGANESGA